MSDKIPIEFYGNLCHVGLGTPSTPPVEPQPTAAAVAGAAAHQCPWCPMPNGPTSSQAAFIGTVST